MRYFAAPAGPPDSPTMLHTYIHTRCYALRGMWRDAASEACNLQLSLLAKGLAQIWLDTCAPTFWCGLPTGQSGLHSSRALSSFDLRRSSSPTTGGGEGSSASSTATLSCGRVDARSKRKLCPAEERARRAAAGCDSSRRLRVACAASMATIEVATEIAAVLVDGEHSSRRE